MIPGCGGFPEGKGFSFEVWGPGFRVRGLGLRFGLSGWGGGFVLSVSLSVLALGPFVAIVVVGTSSQNYQPRDSTTLMQP